MRGVQVTFLAITGVSSRLIIQFKMYFIDINAVHMRNVYSYFHQRYAWGFGATKFYNLLRTGKIYRDEIQYPYLTVTHEMHYLFRKILNF